MHGSDATKSDLKTIQEIKGELESGGQEGSPGVWWPKARLFRVELGFSFEKQDGCYQIGAVQKNFSQGVQFTICFEVILMRSTYRSCLLNIWISMLGTIEISQV